MPRTILKPKKVLIVPLSLFIIFNKDVAGEKFANLHGKFLDDLFSCEEIIKEHEEFSKKLLQKILQSQVVSDFNLGKKTKDEFISELLNLLGLSRDKSTDLVAAWNSLIELDQKSSEAFNALIKLTHQGKSIYFIGDTNALHAEKILTIFRNFRFNHVYLEFLENLPDELPALPLAVSRISDSAADNVLTQQHGTVYFCLSYAYKILLKQSQSFLTQLFKPTSSLLTHLKIYLNEIKTQDDILFVNRYPKEQSIARKLALETIDKENFYTALLNSSADSTPTTPCDPQLVEIHVYKAAI
ncbi:hypothetical protein [Rickettsiella endosymbiont of Litargus connexus]|jgi:hypothetical protein|uniref:hypothetical protein n=1 Tax=Rickettsiella endosymbiont of Litargus connexus TaxID=3066237 RepID=UPI0027F19CF9|nr:hypothetical protein [Gammaproteobacteria bacterium]MDQ5899411.1 hypothetical protein [Pseudomonadota bacterium]